MEQEKFDGINIIGAGLAGCEAANVIANTEVKVRLFEMKPNKFTPAHKSKSFCELVCSNSLKSKDPHKAAGVLKNEMKTLGSLVVECAEKSSIPGGGALCVDREKFSFEVTKKIRENPFVEVIEGEVNSLPKEGITLVATGPLTSGKFAECISKKLGGFLSFYDAASPVVSYESIDKDKCFFANRYDKGEDDAYLNCPLTKDEYEIFYNELISAEVAPLHSFDVENPKVYEDCMPVEVMAKRGKDTLRFGPMKPVGLLDPKTGKRPYAVVQLRLENKQGTLYNIVGFQTNLKFFEQKKVFSLVPALKNAEFLRYGVMHRNSFIDSPKILDSTYALKNDPNTFFAGQLTGVEGYMESAGSGMVVGFNAARRYKGLTPIIFPPKTMLGALASYVSNYNGKNFQPMGANFGILEPLDPHVKNKQLRNVELSKRSLKTINELNEKLQCKITSTS